MISWLSSLSDMVYHAIQSIPGSIAQQLSSPPMIHSTLAHLPVALALLGVPLVFTVVLRRGKERALPWVGFATYLLLALAAYISVRSGENVRDLLPNTLPAEIWNEVNHHEEMAEIIWLMSLTTALLLAYVGLTKRRLQNVATMLAMLGSAVTLGWIGLTGHSGGALLYVHGLGAPALIVETYTYHIAQEMSDENSAQNAGADEPILTVAIEDIDYLTHIEPILKRKCAGCHSGVEPKGDLDLMKRAGLLRGGAKAGPAVVPGVPDKSPLLQYVRGKMQPQMPKDNPPLSPTDIALLGLWIEAGAESPEDKDAPFVVAQQVSKPAKQLIPDASKGTEAIVARLTENFIRNDDPQLLRNLRLAYLSEFGVTNGRYKEGTLVSRFTVNEPAGLYRLRRELRLPLVEPAPALPGPAEQNPIDQHIQAKLTQAGFATEYPLCDDVTFARRVYLDLIGVIPSASEVRAFESATDADKRARLIDILLDRRDDYAAHWVSFWEDALCSSYGDDNFNDTLGMHSDYRDWILASFKENKPYDIWITELISPYLPNSQKSFVLRGSYMSIVQSAANAGQALLGTAMKCASCHNNFANGEWPQERFIEFAGFFADEDLELIRCESHTGKILPAAFAFDIKDKKLDAPEGRGPRLAALASLMVDPTNPRFAKTLANRLWRRFLGLGLCEPIDDLRDDRPGTHPEMLDWLTKDFILNGYDIQHTIRLILNSRTYQHAYDPELADSYSPQQPDAPRYYRSPSLRRLTAEQVVDSMNSALGHPWRDDARTYRQEVLTPLMEALGRPSTRDEVSTSRQDTVGTIQGLELLNGQDYYDLIYRSPKVTALSVQVFKPELQATIFEELYLSVLSRRPTEEERNFAVAYLNASVGRERENYEPVAVSFLDEEDATIQTDPHSRWVSDLEIKSYSGTKSLKQSAQGTFAISTLESPSPISEVLPFDALFAHVYLDPTNPPTAIVLEWKDQNAWAHRAVWGDPTALGESDVEYQIAGPLPEADQWQRLEVIAYEVGLGIDASAIYGCTLSTINGTAYWDNVGMTHYPGGGMYKSIVLGDIFWALFTSPEFQYIF